MTDIFHECIRIHSVRPDGTVMRPRGQNPNEHWTVMLAGPWLHHYGIMVSHPQDEQYPVIDISPQFREQCEHGFRHIMKFVQSNQLPVTINRKQCAVCSGHPACVANGEAK